MKNILVTGFAGCTGSVLTRELLSAGYNVIGVDNFMYGQQVLMDLVGHKNLKIIDGDVCNSELLDDITNLNEIDFVLPLAAIVGAPACKKQELLSGEVNEGHITTLRSLGIPMIFPNTNSQYGSVDGVCTEEVKANPLSIYAEQKCSAEWGLINIPQCEYIILRLATVFGVSPRLRLDLLVNHMVYRALTDGYINLFDPFAFRNYLHVKDLANVYIDCIENFDALKGEVYNVGADYLNMNKEDLCKEIQKYVPEFRYTIDHTQSDPDKRNYKVSSDKLFSKGLVRSPWRGIRECVAEFKNALPMIKMPFRNA